LIRTPCADLIDQLLAQAGEAATVDYKAPMAWPAKATDERARLVRHIIGFANARDGGYLLIGVDDATKKPIGLTAGQANSWNITHVVEAVAQFGAPPPRIAICQDTAPSGELLVAVHIAEFEVQPTVCIQECARKAPGPDADRLILRKGALYIRTGAASTREVESEAMMRDLLRRANAKTGDSLLRQIKELLDLHWPNAPEAKSAELRRRIEADLQDMKWP